MGGGGGEGVGYMSMFYLKASLSDFLCFKKSKAKADQSLHGPLEDALDLWLPTECPAKTLIRLR